VLMVWWPFAPKPERADTLEVTDLHSDAPPLYSTSLREISSFIVTLSLQNAHHGYTPDKLPIV
jgi:hypothetical protein